MKRKCMKDGEISQNFPFHWQLRNSYSVQRNETVHLYKMGIGKESFMKKERKRSYKCSIFIFMKLFCNGHIYKVTTLFDICVSEIRTKVNFLFQNSIAIFFLPEWLKTNSLFIANNMNNLIKFNTMVPEKVWWLEFLRYNQLSIILFG